ncbi:hypothetical protein BT63DRAFT_411374 [Microthyrium microscopicum]|uniref:EDC4-like protein pdc1 beta-propeller domain-containing protein n=1 Tax=Microthyrium microscopicum TaxID=703497 RepID=A0A6A6UIL9_9PEZI|nr:hypothetical protein BT63DRAFT_411374 [Microthyrium microscopicum]
MSDFSSLLARLKSTSSETTSSPSNAAPHNQYHQPSVSSPIYSPAPSGPPPRHPGDIMSPNTSTPSHEPSNGPSLPINQTDLLGLLRSSQVNHQPSRPAPIDQRTTPANVTSTANRPVSAADLVAGFSRPSIMPRSVAPPSVVAPSASRPDLRGEALSSSGNPQDFLLKLLNQSKPEKPPVVSFGDSANNSLPMSFTPPAVSPFAPQLGNTPLPGFMRASADVTTSNSPQQEQMTQITTATLFASEPAQAIVPQSPVNAARVFGQSQEQSLDFNPPQTKAPFTYVNPFEQLSAASPLKGSKPTSRAATPKIEALKHSRAQSNESPPVPNPKSRKIGPGDSPKTLTPLARQRETVAEAVDIVGEQADKQVEEKLEQLSAKAAPIDINPAEIIVAVRPAVTKDLPSPPKSIGSSSVAADWEDEVEERDEPPPVVMWLPLLPFVSYQYGSKYPEPVLIKDSKITNVARMRKDFDQLDRTLVACTARFIVYVLKGGGFRIIRQDSGKFKQLYANSGDRVFNLAIGRTRTATGHAVVELVLGTGVKGSVYWSPLNSLNGPSGTTDDERGFVFPAVESLDEQTSSGQLKTRIKPSNRSHEFFAYGRGKNIHIIYPLLARSSAYTDPKTDICDSAKYLQDDDLKICTGKAAKDFAWSADDTVIASLDKAGKLKFWDVRPLTKDHFKKETRKGEVAEVVTPIMTMNTTLPTEKSWPTSVMFIDREKPMNRGLALRYLIIGLKQNHTIQLWDIQLGKVVQELNFPHGDESDAICTLAYNPRSMILAVGHPTRNSIYIINVSMPVYTHPSALTQAKFVSMCAEKNKNLNPVASTLIFANIREFRLGQRGELRSLDVQADAVSSQPASSEDTNNAPIGAIVTAICMHSKGIFEFSLTREMMGYGLELDKDAKIFSVTKDGMTKIHAIELDAFEMTPLKQPEQDEPTVNQESLSAKTKTDSPGKASKQDVSIKSPPTPLSSVKQDTEGNRVRLIPPPALFEKEKEKVSEKEKAPEKESLKKKKKKGENAGSKSSASAIAKAVSVQHSPSKAGAEAEKGLEPSVAVLQTPSSRNKAPLVENTSVSDAVKHLEMSMSSEFTRILTDQFNILYRRMADDKRTGDALGQAKQDAILRGVTKSLNDNFENHATRMVHDAMKMEMKTVKDSVNGTIDRSITSTLSNAFKTSLPREMEKTIEASLGKILNDGALIRGISNTVSKQVGDLLTKSLPVAFKEVVPLLQNNTAASVQHMTQEVEQRVSDQLRSYEARHQQDRTKIDELTSQVQALVAVTRSMASEQQKFQTDMRALMEHSSPASSVKVLKASGSHTRGQSEDLSRAVPTGQVAQQFTPAVRKQTPQLSEEQEELQTIARLIHGGNLDEAFVQWLHSNRQGLIFDQIFLYLGPQSMENAGLLVILSITAAVSFTLATNLKDRLDWLDYALNVLDPLNEEYRSVLPRIMDVITNRIDQAVAGFSQRSGHPDGSILTRMWNTKRHAQELKAAHAQAQHNSDAAQVQAYVH